MMSPETIRAMSRRAARQSRERGDEPLLVEDHDRGVLGEHLRHMPFIGDRCPRGWRRVPASSIDPALRFMCAVPWHGAEAGMYVQVDSSGFGSPDEPALTYSEFCQWVSRVPGERGYAIVEAGQFQVVVGVFERR